MLTERNLPAFSSSGRGTPWRQPVCPLPRRVSFRFLQAAALDGSDLTAEHHRVRPRVGISSGGAGTPATCYDQQAKQAHFAAGSGMQPEAFRSAACTVNRRGFRSGPTGHSKEKPGFPEPPQPANVDLNTCGPCRLSQLVSRHTDPAKRRTTLTCITSAPVREGARTARQRTASLGMNRARWGIV